MERVFVTGGSGFIGTNLIESLLRDGFEVANFDWHPPKIPQHAPLHLEGDIRNCESLTKALVDFRPEWVVHLAAKTGLGGASLAAYDSNTVGVQNVLDATRAAGTVSRIVVASSRYVHRTEVFPLRDDDYSPFTIYGQSKVETERIVRSSQLEIPWVLVRPTSIWGPWASNSYRMFFDAVRRGVYVHPRGRKISKSFGYVGNAVFQLRQFLSAEASKVDKRTFYVSDLENIEVLQFGQLIQEAFGAPPIRQVPMAVLKALAWSGDVLKRIGMKNPPLTTFRLDNLLTPMNYDMSATREVCGPSPYTLKEGVRATADWIQQHG